MTQEKQDKNLVNPSSTKKTTLMQSILMGSAAGGMEVMVDHPLWSIKTRIQRGEPFTLNPSILYRGIWANAASMVPITALQVGLNRAVQKGVFKDSPLTDSQRVGSAFIAGVGSSLVSCPTEMVMTYQGKVGGNFYSAGTYWLKTVGVNGVYRGLLATALREGMFTTFFLAGTPMLKARVQQHSKNETTASLLAGIGSGVGATLASQAFDTIKTAQQDAPVNKPMGVMSAVHKIYSSQGLYGFFKGSVPRGARVVSAVTIMGYVTDKLESIFDSYNKTQESATKSPKF